MKKKQSIFKISIISIIFCSCFSGCNIIPPYLFTDPAVKPTYNDVGGYYRQVFPEKRRTRYLGFQENNGQYNMNDFDGDGIPNTEAPYPFDAFFPGNIINSIKVPLISSSSSDDATFDIFTVTGDNVLTIGTIDLNINEYLRNFSKTNIVKSYTESGTSGFNEQRLNINLQENKTLKLFIASLNNKYSANSLLTGIFSPFADNSDRDYKQGYNLPNLSNETLVSLGKVIEMFSKKNDPSFTLQQLANELFFFFKGKVPQNLAELLGFFKLGTDPYFELSEDICQNLGLPSNNDLWSYLSYDTVVFSTLYDNSITTPIHCTELKNHIIYTPKDLYRTYSGHFNDNYSQYKITFDSSDLDLQRMVAIKVLIERNPYCL